MNEEVMIPKSYHDKVCEEIIRFKDKQFYDAVHLLDDGTLEITVGDYTKVKRVLVEDDNNFGNLFCEDKADRPQGEWIPCSERLPSKGVAVLVNGIMYDAPPITISTDAPYYYEQGWINAWMPLPEPWKGADDEKSV